jgi:hypothetical protein
VQESLWFVNKKHVRIASNDLRDHANKCLDPIARLFNRLRFRVEPDSIVMYATLLQLGRRRPFREADPKVAEMCGVDREEQLEGVMNDTPHFGPALVIAKQDLETRLRLVLKVTCRLLLHQVDAASAIEHHGVVRQVPWTKVPRMAVRVLHRS